MSEAIPLLPILLTARACAAAMLLFVLVAPPLALFLARRRCALARAVEFVVTLPLVFPPIALGFLLLMALGRRGPVGAALEFAFGVRIVFSEAGVILAAFVAGLPLVVKPLQTAFASERLRELEEAARICGASPFRTLLLVTLPLSRNALLSGLLLGLARASGEVGITLMLGGNIAGRTNTLSLEIFNCVSRGDFDAATMLCVLLAAFAAAVCGLLHLIESRKTF